MELTAEAYDVLRWWDDSPVATPPWQKTKKEARWFSGSGMVLNSTPSTHMGQNMGRGRKQRNFKSQHQSTGVLS